MAYIAPYQGPELLKRRPVLHNLALAGNVKIELIAELPRRGHEVDVISQGEVVEQRFKYYEPFSEPRPFHHQNPRSLLVDGADQVPERTLVDVDDLTLVQKMHGFAPYDLVIIYNLKRPQVVCATM